MHRLLLTAAASAAALIVASPSVAQSLGAAGFSSSPGFTRLPGLTARPVTSTIGGARQGHRHHIHVGDGASPAYYPSGYNDFGDYDANRSFDPDKWNDWWHERPERAFPRWMSRNQDCARQWYSGDVLTC